MRLRVLVFVILLLAVPAEAQQLAVGPKAGHAPLTVTISGPKIVMDKIEQCVAGRVGWFGRGGNGLTVDWGDGSDPFVDQVFNGREERAASSCAEAQRTHVYTVPGRYTLKVRAWHPGPTDAPVTDWAGEATITVTGKGPADSLEVGQPQAGQELRYQEYPRIRVRAAVSAASQIRAELFAADGQSIGAIPDIDWASSGEREIYLSPRDPQHYDNALKRGQKSFTARISLMRDGKTVLSKDVGPYSMTAQYGATIAPLQLKQFTRVGNGYKGEFGLSLYHPSCSSYSVEWGDGQKTEKILPPPKECLLNTQQIELEHTYARAGTYQVKVRTNEYNFGKSLREVFAYSLLQVTTP